VRALLIRNRETLDSCCHLLGTPPAGGVSKTWPSRAWYSEPFFPYSARVSILVEIAEKADVSVEGVVRVLTREPVSDAIKERVLAVLDDLTPEQTRAVQRFALAALHDMLDRPDDLPEWPEPRHIPDENQLALPVSSSTGSEPDQRPAASDAALVQLSSVLGELAEAVRDLRRETDAERRERVDDLAVLIDLITTGWQGLDARLGRIERQVSRLEAGRREPAIAPVASAPARAVSPPAAPPAAASSHPSARDRLPIVAALSLVGAAAVTLAVLQLASGGPDVSRLVSSRDAPSTATQEASSTTGAAPPTAGTVTRPAATTSRPPAQGRTAPATTSSVLGTTSAGTRPKPPAAPTTGRTTSAPPATTTRPGATTSEPAGFEPTRNWAWAPVDGADYYDVVFTRAGTTFYRASPTQPRLALPASVVFRPGPYRWVVRPGFGARSAKRLGPPVVDSPFTVS
jgi:Bacterial regulatory proteins, lacI family